MLQLKSLTASTAWLNFLIICIYDKEKEERKKDWSKLHIFNTSPNLIINAYNSISSKKKKKKKMLTIVSKCMIK